VVSEKYQPYLGGLGTVRVIRPTRAGATQPRATRGTSAANDAK
jgi:hypothetical protein